MLKDGNMRDFEKWSAADRQKSLTLTNRAKRLGLIYNPTKCEICGQTEGILHHHNSNYDVTLSIVPKMLIGSATDEEILEVKKVMHEICWRCHMMYHSQHINMSAVNSYFRSIKDGAKYPPVFKHDFSILAREHGIIKRYKK